MIFTAKKQQFFDLYFFHRELSKSNARNNSFIIISVPPPPNEVFQLIVSNIANKSLIVRMQPYFGRLFGEQDLNQIMSNVTPLYALG